MGANISKACTESLISTAVIDFGIQWIGWAVASYFKTEKFYDLAGSSTFLLLAWLTLRRGNTLHQRQVLQTSAVCAWALRLGTFLFSRVLLLGRDKRFDKVRENPMYFFMYWTIQGVWIWITLLPTIILNAKTKDEPLSRRDYLGWVIFGLGLLIESVADHQKMRFKSQRENHGKWVDSGLWSISRHPNYLGEILCWFGLFLPASSVMNNTELLSGISPVFVVYILTNVSGIPLLQKTRMKKWGKDPAYLEYVKNTAKLIPYVW